MQASVLWAGSCGREVLLPIKREQKPQKGSLLAGHPATWLFGHSREEGCKQNTTGSLLLSHTSLEGPGCLDWLMLHQRSPCKVWMQWARLWADSAGKDQPGPQHPTWRELLSKVLWVGSQRRPGRGLQVGWSAKGCGSPAQQPPSCQVPWAPRSVIPSCILLYSRVMPG